MDSGVGTMRITVGEVGLLVATRAGTNALNVWAETTFCEDDVRTPGICPETEIGRPDSGTLALARLPALNSE
jgi:hypothetical protein